MASADYTLSVQQGAIRAGRLRSAGVLGIAALGAWFVWTWILNIERILRYYTPAPYLDYWRTAQMLSLYETFNLRVLWMQHNEHRIVFPEIMFAADYFLLHGRQVLPIAVSFACYFGCWLVLVWAFGSDTAMPARVRISGALVAGVIIGWEGSAVVLVNPFLLQWTLTSAAAMFSLAFLVRLKESGRSTYLVGLIIAGVVATYSAGNGLLVWPLVTGGGLILSLRPRHIVVIASAGAIASGIYFVDYRFTGTLSLTNLIRHPVFLVKFVASYLAMPFSAVTPYWVGWTLGMAAMCLVVLLALIAGRAGLMRSRVAIVLFGSYLYALLTGVLIAAGRMDPLQVGIGNAKYSRYLVEPLISWAALVLLCVWMCSRLVKRAVATYGVVAMFAVLALVGFSRRAGWISERDVEFANVQRGALAMQNDVFDRGALLYVFPWGPQIVETWSRALREGNFSVFYKGYRRWLGKPVTKLGITIAAGVPGEITEVTPVSGGVEITGWAEWDELRHSAGWVLFVDQSGQVVGLGRKLPAGFPPQLRNLRTPERLGWVGFVNAKYAAASVRAYVIAKRGLVPLEGSGLFRLASEARP